MRPTIANANILRFRNQLRPEGVANVAGLLEPIVSQVKNSLNEMTTVSPSGSNVVETPEYYRNLPSTNIPVGDFLVGNADRALLDVSQHRPPDPYDVIDLGLLGVDAFFPARGAVKLTGKALTSPFAKDIYANVPNAVNRLNQRFTGIDLQPDIMMGEKSLLWNKLGGDSEQFLKNEKAGMNPEQNWKDTGTYRGVDGMLRQEIDDSGAKLDYDAIKLVKGDVRGNQLLKDVYKHDLLYKAYPDLANPDLMDRLKVSKRNMGSNTKLGSFNPVNNEIKFNDGLRRRKARAIEYFRKDNPELYNAQVDPEAVVNHEVQHAVQAIEGFDTGSSTARGKIYPKLLEKKIKERENIGFPTEKITSILDDILPYTPNERYLRKSGEVEARTSQARRNLSAEDRRDLYPLYESKTIEDKIKNQGVTFSPTMTRVEAEKLANQLERNYGKDNVSTKHARSVAYGLDFPKNQVYSLRETGIEDDLLDGNFSYLENTPKKPNELVGTRYEKEYVGDLVTPENITGKELEGSTILTKPSDTTSRGEKIKSISDEFFEQQPPTTEGGFDFALSKKNIKEGKYYGSGLEQVDTDTRRMIQAFRENKAQGGSGRMMFTPSTMGTYSESFSTMPFENLMPILAKAKPEAIAKVNNEIRQIYPEFSGLNTPAGTSEILNHGNLRKLAMERLRTKSAQKDLGYNAEDLYNAVRSERFVGVGKNMIGDTLVEMDTALLQRADDMLNDAGITNLSQSKEARKARSPEQNAVLDEVYAMFRKDMGDSHRTYKVANTGATENRFTLDANLPLIEVAGDNMINDLMRGKVDYSIDPNKIYSNKVTPDEAQNIIHTGHKNVGLFIDSARAKRIDDARKSGQFDKKITSIFDDFIK